MAKKKGKKPKRANGEGSITRLADGRYKAVVTVPGVGRQNRRSKTVASHAAAVAFIAEVKAESLGPKAVAPAATGGSASLLGDWLTTWLADQKRDSSPRTHELYEECVEGFIIPGMGRIALADIDPMAVRNFIHSLHAEYGGRRRLQQVYETLSRSLNAAVRAELLGRNPCKAVSRPKYDPEKPDPFTQAEARRILDAAATGKDGEKVLMAPKQKRKPRPVALKKDGTERKIPDLRPLPIVRIHGLLVLGFTTGMRIGELLGLHWDRIDFKAGTLRVDQQAISKGGKIIIKPPKSKASNRTIRLPEVALDALAERQAEAMHEKLAACPIVFPGPKGSYWRNSAFGARIWRPLLAQLGIPSRGVHQVRHTYATLTLGAGEPVHVVSAIMGHSDVATTLRLYAHAIPDQQRQAAETAQRLFGAG